MNENTKRHTHHREGVISAVSAGCFLILIGFIFATSLNVGNVTRFLENIDAIQVAHTGIYLPAPRNPSAHTVLYSAVELFSLIWAFFEIAFLGLRFAFNATPGRKAENAGNIVFWFGTYYLIGKYLVNISVITGEAHTSWFSFWAILIALIGVTLIVRAIVLAALTYKR